MKLKQIELTILIKQWEKLPECIKAYEKIAKKYLAQPLLKSNAQNLFFNSCLCFLANDDVVGAKKQVQMYGIEDPSFDGSRDQELISKIVKHIQNKNSEEFSLTISEYNQITPFSKLQTSLMVKIKEMYLPEEANQFVQNENEIDFTGANEQQSAFNNDQQEDNEPDFR